MRVSTGSISRSPTDLSAFLGCRHRTGLDLAVALGLLPKPEWFDPAAALLRERGEAHERQFVNSLRSQGVTLVDLRGADDAFARTVAAMQAGADVIVQGRLDHGQWTGYADVLRRVDTPSELGPFSYEVWDTKLARETRGGTILQLSTYSDLLSRIQGLVPEHFYVVTPDPVHPVHAYRVDDYSAYYRLVRAQLEAAIAQGTDALQELYYPEPVEHCDVCRWWTRCNARRRQDDHLSFIADISRLHRRELEANGVPTLAAAAAMPIPIPFQPSRGSHAAYQRIREQARLQAEQRTTRQPVHQLLPVEPEHGLCRLPAPSPGDLFLDLEGDPFARDRGREYLFGVGWPREDESFGYRSWWAGSDAEERTAFEQVIDVISEAWQRDPGMHVYHFGHYEPSAFKRLMGRYATREAEIDRLLRGERFVNLLTVVKQGLRAGVESYSIKALETFYDFSRDIPLDDAATNKQLVELALESNAANEIPDEVRNTVEGYNRDDCRSTLVLRDWLERLRAELESSGTPVPRPPLSSGEASENVSELEAQVQTFRVRLLDGVPLEPDARTEEQGARWLLAWLLDWHRRENRAQWWEYYRLRDLPEEELLDEPKALAGLQFVGEVAKVKKSIVHRYSFSEQAVEIRAGAKVKLQDGGILGSVEALDRERRAIDIKQGPTRADIHPTAVFEHDAVSPDVMQRSILRLAGRIADGGFGHEATHGSGMDLLFRRPPRVRSGAFTPPEDGSVSDFAVRIVTDLDETVLPIQGPPGAGKTFTGSRMICTLVNAGKRVGVTAVSHKVIRNLLDAVQKRANELGIEVRVAHKTDGGEFESSTIVEVDDNAKALGRLQTGESQVLGGTAWLWARPEAADAVDVLLVDEAGQMSLANVLAVCQAASSVVLLGDPQQLEQPQKASHPDGTDISALEHVLGGAKTMPADRGIFLPQTWRLAPEICSFTSEAFYERRLNSKVGLERQRLSGTTGFDGAGLWWVPVEHDGNQNWSDEEIEAVVQLFAALTQPSANWVDDHNATHPLTGKDILIVAPYNAHVNRLEERLRESGARIGTVDKFQGQEEAVVIYSMATSRPEDAPRGMEFLYSLNRLNVATSRARCTAILVASPRLFEPECRTPRQMQLANALCRFRELARIRSVPLLASSAQGLTGVSG